MAAVLTQRMSLDSDGAVYLSNTGNVTQQKEERSQRADFQQHERGQQLDEIAGSPPPLPERDARRNSRFLDALLDSKTTATVVATAVAVSLKATDAAQPTPHDVYLSSEEDASSMGEFSDYDDDDEYSAEEPEVYELSSGLPLALASSASTATTAPVSPTEHSSLPTTVRRHSHDIARVVSVVFSGKPSLVDLAAERQSRRRSLQDRATSPSASLSSVSSSIAASELNNTRPSTSYGSLVSTAASSTNSSPKTHKRVHSGSMLASFRARKNAVLNVDSHANGSTYTLSKMVVPAAEATSAAPSAIPAPTPITITPSTTTALPSRSLTTSMLPPSTENSPRTPTFGHGNLLKGVTRTLTKGRKLRRAQPKDNTAVPATPSPTSPDFVEAQAPPLPAEERRVSGEPVTYNDIIQSARRKSLAMSVVSSMTAMNAPPPAPPVPDQESSIALPRSFTTPMPPADTVTSKKGGSGFLGNLTGRRRSLKLL